MPDDLTEPEVEISSEDKKEDELSQVTVDLDKKSPDQTQEKSTQTKESDRFSEDLKKLHNTIAYQTRQLERAMREMEELKRVRNFEEPKKTEIPKEDLDEIDIIAQKDWKLGVKKVVEKDIESTISFILEKRKLEETKKFEQQNLYQQLEKSKQVVLSKYPKIEDEETEESNIYRQVINEDPSILKNVNGPEIAMYRMEERLKLMGKTPAGVRPMIDKEVSRLVRAGVSSVVGKQINSNGKITLTKEQKEFCDHYSIPYEQYAKNLKLNGESGGVVV